MRIRFLGTAAAEAFPALFCTCDHCARALAAGGRNLRSRFSIEIDDIYKLDLPPDTYHHFLREGLKLADLEYLFISHQHQDHYYPQELVMREAWFAKREQKRLNLFGNEFVIARAREILEVSRSWAHTCNFHTLQAFRTVEAGRYRVTPLEANHMTPAEKPFIYLFEDIASGKRLLLAHDTGYFPDRTWEFLSGKRLDFVSADCTSMLLECRNGHMGLNTVIEVRDRLAAEGNITEATPVYLNHFSHNGGLTHDELTAKVKDAGLLVAYDGLKTEV